SGPPAACEIGDCLGGKGRVAFTQSGDTARRLCRYRGAQPIRAFPTDESTRNQRALSWGVEPHVVPFVNSTDEMVDLVDQQLVELNRCGEGDVVIITAGSPPGGPGTTNMVRVHHLGGTDP